MTEPLPPYNTVLIAEDDDDHYLLTVEAMETAGLEQNPLRVRNGEELLKYLSQATSLPRLILLDLNMPRKGGFEVLVEIKKHPRWAPIPIVAFSTSLTEEDVSQGRGLGVDAFLRKPIHFNQWVQMMKGLKSKWFEGPGPP